MVEQTEAAIRVVLCKHLLAPATFKKKRLWHRCFPVNFTKFLRKPFLTVNTSGQLLLCKQIFAMESKITARDFYLALLLIVYYMIYDALRDLVLFLQFKKREKHP